MQQITVIPSDNNIVMTVTTIDRYKSDNSDKNKNKNNNKSKNKNKSKN